MMNNQSIVTEEELDRSKIFIAGLNIDPAQARYRCQVGKLEQIQRGIFLDAGLSPTERRSLLVKNAARITIKLFPQSMLAGSSAFHRGSVEGHLMIASPRYTKPIDVGGAFTIYSSKTNLDLGLNKEVEFVTIEDSFGTHYIKRIADELLIIKNFMPNKVFPRSTYLNNADLSKVVERCMRTLGGREPFLRRLEALGNAHSISHYLPRVHAFIDNASTYVQTEKPLKAFHVYWHHTPVAMLSHDGHIWSFEYEPQVQLQLSINEKKGRGSPPSFLGSLLPETGVKVGKTMEENLGDFGRGHRYISNITVQPSGSQSAHKNIIIDMLDGELPSFRSDHLEFNGTTSSDLLGVMNDEDLLSSLHRDPDSPRMSGMQIKLPANLARDGSLSSAKGKAFTHIIKIVGSNPLYQSMCSMEWFSLTIAKACGMNVEEYAVVDMGGHGPSLVVERFDVRKDLNDKRMILAEDFWSIEGLIDNRQKYSGELMNVADIVIKHSTAIEKDARHLLAQVIFSWLTWNGDLHLKNLLLLKETKDSHSGFDTIRLSPIYDILCTQVFPDDAKSSAISLSGNRNHTLAGLRVLGKKLGIEQDEVDSMVEFLAVSIPSWAQKIANNLPQCIQAHPQSVGHIEKAQGLFDVRCLMMFAELENSRKNQGRRKTIKDSDVESFNAAPIDTEGAGEHFEAERRRSWEPTPVKGINARSRRP